MLYKPDGKKKLHGVMVDYVVVDESEVADHLDSGWFKTPLEADQSKESNQFSQEDYTEALKGQTIENMKDNLTKKDMKQVAKSIGLKGYSRLNEQELAELIYSEINKD